MSELFLIALLTLPLVGAGLTYSLGQIKPGLSPWIASLICLLSFGCTLAAGQDIFLDASVHQTVKLFPWFQFGQLDINVALLWDSLSLFMCLIITGVGSLIHFYSIAYMSDDESRPRFFAYLNLFIFFMLTLVLADNLLLLFVGWEGVGLCSYLLISFWYKNIEFAAAGKKAFIYNRIGDAGLLLAIFCLIFALGEVEFLGLAKLFQTENGSQPLLYVAALGLFLAVSGKSAQIPLYVWLPDAMAGPTPVSALIHAATMVTAGVYLMSRMFYLFDAFPMLQQLIFAIAICTCLVSGLIAIAQNDLKKILAYSTVSQLGLMFMAVSSGAYGVALFHVLTHAFFKAGLFLSAGNIIHALHGEQSVQKMGGLWNKLPVTFVVYLICTLAISAIYPLAGYFSKHLILESVHDAGYLASASWVLTFISILTVVYMTRSLVLVFFGKSKSGTDHLHHPALLMNLPIIVLALLALVSGLFIPGVLPEFLSGSIKTFQIHGESVGSAISHSILPVLAFVATLILVPILAKYRNIGKLLFFLPRHKFFIDEIYNGIVAVPFRKLADLLAGLVERVILGMTIDSLTATALVGSKCLSLVQGGQLRFYSALSLIAILVLLFFTILY